MASPVGNARMPLRFSDAEQTMTSPGEHRQAAAMSPDVSRRMTALR